MGLSRYAKGFLLLLLDEILYNKHTILRAHDPHRGKRSE